MRFSANEDPIELATPGIRQLAVDARHGITMTLGLRARLRLDPDIVFVSEIRDAEALEIAMRAASYGKDVFSTLHTRDVASTITAPRDLHIDNIDNRSFYARNAAVASARRRPNRICSLDTMSFYHKRFVGPWDVHSVGTLAISIERAYSKLSSPSVGS